MESIKDTYPRINLSAMKVKHRKTRLRLTKSTSAEINEKYKDNHTREEKSLMISIVVKAI